MRHLILDGEHKNLEAEMSSLVCKIFKSNPFLFHVRAPKSFILGHQVSSEKGFDSPQWIPPSRIRKGSPCPPSPSMMTIALPCGGWSARRPIQGPQIPQIKCKFPPVRPLGGQLQACNYIGSSMSGNRFDVRFSGRWVFPMPIP